jgi:hypothetical protein
MVVILLLVVLLATAFPWWGCLRHRRRQQRRHHRRPSPPAPDFAVCKRLIEGHVPAALTLLVELHLALKHALPHATGWTVMERQADGTIYELACSAMCVHVLDDMDSHEKRFYCDGTYYDTIEETVAAAAAAVVMNSLD